MINIIKQSLNDNKVGFTTSSIQGDRNINSGQRNNVFTVEFIDNDNGSLTNQINKIISQIQSIESLPDYQKIDNFNLSNFVRSVSGIPDRTAPDQQEIRTPFVSYRYQTTRQTFDTISISFIEPFGTFIKFLFKYYIYQYIINPVYNVIQEQNNYKFLIRVTHYSNIIDKFEDTLTSTQLKQVKQYDFYGQFPTIVNGLQLQYDSTEPITTDVTFSYDYWEVKDVSDSTVDTIKNNLK